MIGNDVIDLQLAATQSNWQRQGFLNKVFTDTEQKLILNASNPFDVVWLLWSMKESSYKAHLQQHPKRFFNSIKLKCSLINNLNGIVQIDSFKYTTYTTITKACIHTVAIAQKDNPFSSTYFTLSNKRYDIQHIETYDRFLSEIAQIKKFNRNTISMRKDKLGIPKVFQESIPIDVSFSLSHHGNYGAYAILN